jgi:hypothetical protein
MTNPLESPSSSTSTATEPTPPGWIKLGVVAAASVLAGGLAAAWWYRKTLTRLQQAEEKPINPHFGIPEDDPGDEG